MADKTTSSTQPPINKYSNKSNTCTSAVTFTIKRHGLKITLAVCFLLSLKNIPKFIIFSAASASASDTKTSILLLDNPSQVQTQVQFRTATAKDQPDQPPPPPPPPPSFQKQSRPPPHCPSPLLPFQDINRDNNTTEDSTTRRSKNNNGNNGNGTSTFIQKSVTIHTTSRIPCVTQPYKDVLDQWQDRLCQFAAKSQSSKDQHQYQHHQYQYEYQYSLKLWDDEDIRQYFQAHNYWRDYFPNLKKAIQCLPTNNGAALADLWRYLLLWDQGSGGNIFTDMDNAPGSQLDDILGIISTTRRNEDDNNKDMIIPINPKGRLTQSFMAVASSKRRHHHHHPLMYLALTQACDNLLALSNLSTQDAAHTTGPFVLGNVFQQFINDGIATTTGTLPKDTFDRDHYDTYNYNNHAAGIYTISSNMAKQLQDLFPGQHWMHQRFLTIVGNIRDPHAYVRTAKVRGAAKKQYYKLLGMQQWQTAKKRPATNEEHLQHYWTGSCQSYLEYLERNNKEEDGSGK